MPFFRSFGSRQPNSLASYAPYYGDMGHNYHMMILPNTNYAPMAPLDALQLRKTVILERDEPIFLSQPVLPAS